VDLPTLDWGDDVVTVMLSLSGVIGPTGLRAGAEGFDHLQQQARREQWSSAGGRGGRRPESSPIEFRVYSKRRGGVGLHVHPSLLLFQFQRREEQNISCFFGERGPTP
jgi:hypothetical protein